MTAQEISPEALAEVAHVAYEREAALSGWQTNVSSRKVWGEVPEANKRCTRAAVRAILQNIREDRRTKDAVLWLDSYVAEVSGGDVSRLPHARYILALLRTSGGVPERDKECTRSDVRAILSNISNATD